mgnify:CR=1 FL=1
MYLINFHQKAIDYTKINTLILMKKTIFNLILTLFIVSCSSTKQNSNLESATLDFNNNTEVHIIMANGNLKDGRMNFPMNFNEKKIKMFVLFFGYPAYPMKMVLIEAKL